MYASNYCWTHTTNTLVYTFSKQANYSNILVNLSIYRIIRREYVYAKTKDFHVIICESEKISSTSHRIFLQDSQYYIFCEILQFHSVVHNHRRITQDRELLVIISKHKLIAAYKLTLYPPFWNQNTRLQNRKSLHLGPKLYFGHLAVELHSAACLTSP